MTSPQGSKLDYVKNRGWIPEYWDGRILKIVRSYKAVIGEQQLKSPAGKTNKHNNDAT
mgnify:CR=1 FL=1